MKHIIKQIVIIALMFSATIGAEAATSTVTFTFVNTPQQEIIYDGGRLELYRVSGTPWSSASGTCGEFQVSITGNQIRVTQDNYLFGNATITFTHNSKYIVAATVVTVNYMTGEENIPNEYDYSQRAIKSVSVTKEYIKRIVLTLSDNDPRYDLSFADLYNINSSYPYTGSAITPEPEVWMGGSTKLTKGTHYTVSYTNNINVGTATVTVTGTGSYTGSISQTFTISTGVPTVTPPTILGPFTYDGTAHTLCSAGTTSVGTLEYSTDNSTWITSLPTATNGGTYRIYYRVPATTNNAEVTSSWAGTATINPATTHNGCLTFDRYATDNVSLTIGESDGSAAQDISITDDVDNVKSITMNRTFTEGKAATVMLPFSIATSKIIGGTFYSFIGVDKTNDGWDVVMKEVNRQSGTLQAHTPYLFMPSATEMTFDLDGESVTVKANSQQTYTVQP